MKGRCLCGAVRFKLSGTPTAFDLCHCSRCREASGSAFLAELEFNAPEFEWVSGQSLVKTYEAPVVKTPPGYRRTFCTLCGAPVPTVDRDIIRVPAGTLDDGRSLRPPRSPRHSPGRRAIDGHMMMFSLAHGAYSVAWRAP